MSKDKVPFNKHVKDFWYKVVFSGYVQTKERATALADTLITSVWGFSFVE
jgi:hypothetical protein